MSGANGLFTVTAGHDYASQDHGPVTVEVSQAWERLRVGRRRGAGSVRVLEFVRAGESAGTETLRVAKWEAFPFEGRPLLAKARRERRE